MLEIEKFDKIIVANWKLNGLNSFIQAFVDNIDFKKQRENDCLVICPPFPYINNFKTIKCHLGAQDCSIYTEGAYTGEVSAKILKDIGCDFCIVGHSERRLFYNENNLNISKKVHQCVDEEIIPILCIGETLEQKNKKQTKEILINQISECLPKKIYQNIIIAYEPVWAIGTGLTPTLNEIKEIHEFIKKNIKHVNKFRILYGGSVKSSNFREIISINGVLLLR